MTPHAVGKVFSEVIDDMENGVFDFTVDGKCSRCGSCCSRYLPLSRSEIRDIKRYVEKKHIQRQIHIGAPLATPAALDMTCPFLDMTNPSETKCAIYKCRPAICRKFLCSQPPSQIKENKEQFWKDRRPCDMVEVFFNGR